MTIFCSSMRKARTMRDRVQWLHREPPYARVTVLLGLERFLASIGRVALMPQSSLPQSPHLREGIASEGMPSHKKPDRRAGVDKERRGLVDFGPGTKTTITTPEARCFEARVAAVSEAAQRLSDYSDYSGSARYRCLQGAVRLRSIAVPLRRAHTKVRLAAHVPFTRLERAHGNMTRKI